jgi:hypothetical protein
VRREHLIAGAEDQSKMKAVAEYVRRLGGSLAAPKETLRRVREGRGGFNGLLLLMALQVVGLQLPALGKAAWHHD